MNCEEKRKQFFKENPIIFDYYEDIKANNSVQGIAKTMDRVNEIKEYAILHTSFYSNYKVSDQFPILTKQDYINNYDSFKSNELFSNIHISSTSGSTGTPFSVNQDENKRKRTIADLKVFGEYAGFKSHEPIIQLRAYNGKIIDRKIDENENIWRYDSSKLKTNEQYHDFINFYEEVKPVCVFGYSSTMVNISNFIIDNNIKLKHKLKSVLVGAEIFSENMANIIMKAFECDVYDRYSNMENGILAQKKFDFMGGGF